MTNCRIRIDDEIERDLLRSKDDVLAGRMVPNKIVMKMLKIKMGISK